jgi:hypothetical protein
VTKVKFNKEYTQYLKAQKVLKEKLLIKPLNYMLTDPPQNFQIALIGRYVFGTFDKSHIR